MHRNAVITLALTVLVAAAVIGCGQGGQETSPQEQSNTSEPKAVPPPEEDGTRVVLIKNQSVVLPAIGEGTPDHCFVEYLGLASGEQAGAETASALQTPGKASFLLRHQREAFDDTPLELDQLDGAVSETVERVWNRPMVKRGQVIGYTRYDAYGQPVPVEQPKIETLRITVEFKVLDAQESEATILLLPSSSLVSRTE